MRRWMSHKAWLVAIGLVALGSLPLFGAQDGPKPGVLTDTAVRDLLVGLGHEPESVGERSQRIVFEPEELEGKLYVDLGLSGGGGRVLWVTTYLGEMKSKDEVQGSTMYDLLVANDTYGPNHFYILEDSLYIGRAIDNRSVSPSAVRTTLEDFIKAIGSTTDLWTAVTAESE